MKRTFIAMALLSVISIYSCSESDEPTPAPVNPNIGTKWMAQDDISKLIYGGTCTTTIEFLTETNAQQIDARNGVVTNTYGATCKFWGDSVSWTTSEIYVKGRISGSTLTSSFRTLAGGQRIYSKQ